MRACVCVRVCVRQRERERERERKRKCVTTVSTLCPKQIPMHPFEARTHTHVYSISSHPHPHLNPGVANNTGWLGRQRGVGSLLKKGPGDRRVSEGGWRGAEWLWRGWLSPEKAETDRYQNRFVLFASHGTFLLLQ